MTVTPTSEPPIDEEKMVRYVKEQYSKAKTSRTSIERQWYLNMAFYRGDQYVTLLQDSKNGITLNTPKAPYWRSRPVVNKVRGAVRTELAKLTSNKPSAVVIPNSSEDADTFAAQAAEQIWQSFYDKNNVQRVLRETVWWTLICGTGFIKCWWDPQTIDKASKQLGEIGLREQTPFHIFVPNLREKDIDKQPWVIQVDTISVDEARLKYGSQLAGKKLNADVKTSDDILSSAYLGLAGTDKIVDAVMVYEMWCLPGVNMMLPNGGLVTIVGEHIVQLMTSWPYKVLKYPYMRIEHIPSGHFYGDSVIKDLIPIQREYNRTRGQIIEAKNRMAKPQLIAPRGSIDPSKITTEPGQVILYQPGFAPPQPLPLQALPSYVLQEVDRLQMEFDDISSQHEVSRGNVPSGVTAATAISYLQEQDDTKLHHTVESIEEAIEKLAQHVLGFVVQYWTTPRTVKVVGMDGAFDTLVLKGTDISDNTDIRIEAGSALPTSKAAKQAFIMDLMKMGFIDPNEGLQLLDLGGVSNLYEDLQKDKRQAQRENLRMSTLDPMLIDEYNAVMGLYDQLPENEMGVKLNPQTGEPIEPPKLPIEVNSWDDHGKHIEVHNSYRKSQAFEVLSDQIKQIFDLHVKGHVNALMQAYMPGGDPSAMMTSSAPSSTPTMPGLMSQNPEMAQDPNAPTQQTDPSLQQDPNMDTIQGG